MGNTQTNEVKTKMGKSPGKVKNLIKIRGKRGGKAEDVSFFGVVPDDHEKQKIGFEKNGTYNTVCKEQTPQEQFAASASSEDSSSNSIFTDPLTPVGISTEINECYRSEENFNAKDNLNERSLNNLKLNEFKLKEKEALSKKLSKLGLSKISQISLECDLNYCFVSENIVCAYQHNKNSVDEEHPQTAGPDKTKNHSVDHITTQTNEGSLVLRRVVSLTLDKEALENKICKPKFVPEKLDFKLYEKFEGHMLINWYLSEFHQNSHLSRLMENQDLKLLATQFCTHLLAAGVLHQIPDKDVPMYTIFKPDLMYYWAHSETPASVPHTPGRLNSLSWPPTSPCPSDVFTPNSIANSDTAMLEPILSKDGEVLENEANTSKHQDIEKYRTLIETLTANTIKDFECPNKSEHFICHKCGSSSNYINIRGQSIDQQLENKNQPIKTSTPYNSFNDETQENNSLPGSPLPQLLTDNLHYKSALDPDYAHLHIFENYKTPPPKSSAFQNFITRANGSFSNIDATSPLALLNSTLMSSTSISPISITDSANAVSTPLRCSSVIESPPTSQLSHFALNSTPLSPYLSNKILPPPPLPFAYEDPLSLDSAPTINRSLTSSPSLSSYKVISNSTPFLSANPLGTKALPALALQHFSVDSDLSSFPLSQITSDFPPESISPRISQGQSYFPPVPPPLPTVDPRLETTAIMCSTKSDLPPPPPPFPGGTHTPPLPPPFPGGMHPPALQPRFFPGGPDPPQLPSPFPNELHPPPPPPPFPGGSLPQPPLPPPPPFPSGPVLMTGGIPPPPPLLGSTPLPLPTPPTGGWTSTKSTLSKEIVTPKTAMKPLYWTRIVVPTVSLAETSSKPIWSQVEELKLKNLSEFSNLFSREVIRRNVTKKKVKSKAKIEPVKMLDSKRSQNVGILAQSLHVDFTEIENAIYTFDTSVVSLEALQQICEIRATSEELHKIHQHLKEKPDIPLDKPEQFLYDLSEISNFPERIASFMFQIEFEDSMTHIENTLTNIKSICDFLTDNRSLIKVLSIILTLGNYMNGGNITRGQADGYGLEILSKLKDVKSNDAQVTLLHFIVRTYMNEFDYVTLSEMPLPVPESEDIRKAASVNFQEVFAALQILDNNLKACENRIKKVLETSANDNIEPFKGKMKLFVNNAKEQLQAQYETLENCKTKFVSTMNMYQFKSKVQTTEAMPLNDFFDLWYLFCKDFKDIWKKELIRREKEKKQELKVKEALRKSEVVRVDIKPNSIKEKVRQLLQEEIN